jgi:purine nucleosidase
MGITTVLGESEKRAMVADAICRAAGREIPIYPGIEKPIMQHPLYMTPGGAAQLVNWEHETVFQKHQAIDFMRKTIRDHPGEITLLAIGALTNVAVLFTVDPEIPALLKEIVLMYGLFGEELKTSFAAAPVNKESFCSPLDGANFNAWCDPHAAAIVYKANVPVHRSIGIDVTMNLTLQKEEVEKLFNTNILKAVADFGTPWLNDNIMTFHDPLAGVCIFNPQICQYQKGYVRVDTKNEFRLGSTDFCKNEAGNCEIATAVDDKRFFEHYFSVFL